MDDIYLRLCRLARDLAKTTSEDEVLKAAAAAGVDLAPASPCVHLRLSLASGDGSEVRHYTLHPSSGEAGRNGGRPTTTGMASSAVHAVLQSRQPMVVPDVRESPAQFVDLQLLHESVGAVSFGICPLALGGSVLGILTAASAIPGAFSGLEEVLSFFGSTLAPHTGLYQLRKEIAALQGTVQRFLPAHVAMKLANGGSQHQPMQQAQAQTGRLLHPLQIHRQLPSPAVLQLQQQAQQLSQAHRQPPPPPSQQQQQQEQQQQEQQHILGLHARAPVSSVGESSPIALVAGSSSRAVATAAAVQAPSAAGTTSTQKRPAALAAKFSEIVAEDGEISAAGSDSKGNSLHDVSGRPESPTAARTIVAAPAATSAGGPESRQGQAREPATGRPTPLPTAAASRLEAGLGAEGSEAGPSSGSRGVAASSAAGSASTPRGRTAAPAALTGGHASVVSAAGPSTSAGVESGATSAAAAQRSEAQPQRPAAAWVSSSRSSAKGQPPWKAGTLRFRDPLLERRYLDHRLAFAPLVRTGLSSRVLTAGLAMYASVLTLLLFLHSCPTCLGVEAPSCWGDSATRVADEGTAVNAACRRMPGLLCWGHQALSMAGLDSLPLSVACAVALWGLVESRNWSVASLVVLAALHNAMVSSCVVQCSLRTSRPARHLSLLAVAGALRYSLLWAQVISGRVHLSVLVPLQLLRLCESLMSMVHRCSVSALQLAGLYHLATALADACGPLTVVYALERHLRHSFWQANSEKATKQQ